MCAFHRATPVWGSGSWEYTRIAVFRPIDSSQIPYQASQLPAPSNWHTPLANTPASARPTLALRFPIPIPHYEDPSTQEPQTEKPVPRCKVYASSTSPPYRRRIVIPAARTPSRVSSPRPQPHHPHNDVIAPSPPCVLALRSKVRTVRIGTTVSPNPQNRDRLHLTLRHGEPLFWPRLRRY